MLDWWWRWSRKKGRKTVVVWCCGVDILCFLDTLVTVVVLSVLTEIYRFKCCLLIVCFYFSFAGLCDNSDTSLVHTLCSIWIICSIWPQNAERRSVLILSYYSKLDTQCFSEWFGSWCVVYLYYKNRKHLSVPQSQWALTLYPATDCTAATDISSVSGRWQLSR